MPRRRRADPVPAQPDAAETRQTVRTLAAETFGRHDPLAWKAKPSG